VIEQLLRGAFDRAADLVGLVSHRVWRVGHVSAPLDFVPHEYCSWEHRFDDPRREYRTIYGAQYKVTALREVLADLRPSTKARADFAQFQLDQGVPVEELAIPAREVTAVWRQSHALAPGRVVRDGPLVDLDDPALLEQLATRYATLLAEHGMAQLNVSEIRSKNRPVTQTIGRDLYDRGVAGILFRSNQDNKRCIVVMEGRSRLVEDGKAIRLTEDIPELLLVCSQYNLTLKASGTPEARSIPTIWRP
jgi:RES domain